MNLSLCSYVTTPWLKLDILPSHFTRIVCQSCSDVVNYSTPKFKTFTSEVVGICSINILYLGKLWKGKFFILCLMLLFWWGCREILKLFTLGSETVNVVGPLSAFVAVVIIFGESVRFREDWVGQICWSPDLLFLSIRSWSSRQVATTRSPPTGSTTRRPQCFSWNCSSALFYRTGRHHWPTSPLILPSPLQLHSPTPTPLTASIPAPIKHTCKPSSLFLPSWNSPSVSLIILLLLENLMEVSSFLTQSSFNIFLPPRELDKDFFFPETPPRNIFYPSRIGQRWVADFVWHKVIIGWSRTIRF